MPTSNSFAAHTPFEFPGLQNSAKLLLAMGVNSKDVLPYMHSIGEAVSAIGGNEETLSGVSMAIGQMVTKGKISAEEMGQLAERGIAAWDILSQKMGKSKSELMDMASQGKLFSDQVVPLLVEGMGTKFAGALDKQSKTFNGMISTMKDNLSMLSGKLAQPIFEKLKAGLTTLLKR